MSEILRLSNLKLNYGPIAAIKGIDLTVEEGQIVAILGANGAGKTSTLKVISGLLKPTDGEILFNGEKISGKPAHKVAQLGIMQSPEGRHVLIGLTVEENLRVGAYNIKSKEELQKNFERVYTLFPRLKERAKQQSSTLSGGEQQMLAMGRALLADPELIVLDEPSMGLSPLLVSEIFEIVKSFKEAGKTVLLVEQNAKKAMSISDRVYVLETGSITMSGNSSELINDPNIKKAYLGE